MHPAHPARWRAERRRPVLAHREFRRRIEARLRRHATSRLEDSDWALVPINLVHWQFNRKRPDPGDWILRLPGIERGRTLLLASGDFGQRRPSPWENHASNRPYPRPYPWLDGRFTLLALEATADLFPGDLAFLPFQPEPSRLGRLLGQRPVAWSDAPRELLYCFSGVIAYRELAETHIRGGALRPLVGIGPDHFVGSPAQAAEAYGPAGDYVPLMSRSRFTLCPAGFGRWSFRLVQAILTGSLPVLLADGYVLPFAHRIPWDSFLVRVPERDVAAVPDMLRAMPEEEYCTRVEAMRAARPMFTESGVLDLIVDELRARCASPRPPAATRHAARSGARSLG